MSAVSPDFMGSKNLWASRFVETPSAITQQISESISFDYLLAPYDIAGSKAHVRMLGSQSILSEDQVKNILQGLGKVQSEIEAGKMKWDPALEDIHMHIENRLIELIGEDGKRLHTGRSRNDQVAVDTVQYVREHALSQRSLLIHLLNEVKELAEQNMDKLWAGYTHLQIAQPVLLSHYLFSWFWAFERDLQLLGFCLKECSLSPLGAAALGGANYPIDRDQTASELGFLGASRNSMDSVAQRDYQLSYHFFASRLFIHISRLCEDLVIYNSAEFSYVEFSDQVTTGSSIMPQKKNPDIAELLRGKTGRVTGNLMALLTALKGLPSSYNRDLQEDKIYLMDSIQQVTLGIQGVRELFKHITFHETRVENSLQRGFAQATDIADFLVREHGVPFRQAHKMVGELVAYCVRESKTLSDLRGKDNSFWDEKINLPDSVLDLKECAKMKQGQGSTGWEAQKSQVRQAEEVLKSLESEGAAG